MADPLSLVVNGQPRHLAVAADTPLLYVLRNDLQLNGPKFGCGLGECGACTVHLDGIATRSCVTPVSAAVGRRSPPWKISAHWMPRTRSSRPLSTSRRRSAVTAATA